MPNVTEASIQTTWVDAQFAAMESDEGYRSLQHTIVEEFASSDREGWVSWRTHLSSAYSHSFRSRARRKRRFSTLALGDSVKYNHDIAHDRPCPIKGDEARRCPIIP
jgi:hypothetical protein